VNGRVVGAVPVSGLHAPRAIRTLVDEIAVVLSRAGVPEAAAEGRDIVAVVAGKNRFWPRLHADDSAPADLVARAHAMANRRATGMPFAYAVRRAAFRHLSLEVDERVLIPRQETEVLVDLVLRHRSAKRGGLVADVGTGSGAIALALAAEGHFDRVIATDVAADAIAVARENARVLNAKTSAVVEFRVGDLLAPLRGELLDVLVSNPPYIAFDEAMALPASVRDWEPSHALFSGGQGLDATRKIIEGAPALLCPGGLLALEVDSRRALQVVELIAAGSGGAFGDIVLHQDLMGRDRFVLATRS
jgi:release factor glutamine methyltransferase